jgi:Flp pilus assembly protein TadD
LREPPREDAWRFFISRAASLMELGRWSTAEVDLKRAVEIAPEEATTLNYLGYSWAERGEHLDEAFKLIEKAVALEPGSGAIIDSLGWAHYQLGQYSDAVGHLEQAAALEAADPTITDHLGDVYWRLGREREARYQWRRALELKPSERVRKQIEKKLEQGLDPVSPLNESGAADGST